MQEIRGCLHEREKRDALLSSGRLHNRAIIPPSYIFLNNKYKKVQTYIQNLYSHLHTILLLFTFILLVGIMLKRNVIFVGASPRGENKTTASLWDRREKYVKCNQ